MKKSILDLKWSLTFTSIFVFSLVYLLMLSCEPTPPKGSRASQAMEGKKHFQEYCVSCHGEDGKGLRIDSLETQPADLTLIMKGRTSSDFPVLEVANTIDGRKMSKSHGTRQMPVWGEVFSEQEYMKEEEIKGKLAEMISYIMSIQGT
jgi:mono/diheme cytochrome c family protein